MDDQAPQIVRRADALHVDKPDGTAVDYFIFDEFEVHRNTIAPTAVQQWHHHTEIEEALLVISGELDLISYADGEITRTTLSEGDLARVRHSVHTLANTGRIPAAFVVFRFVPDGVSKTTIIKNDKIVDHPPSSKE